MKVLETDRLVLRWLNAGDAAFILRLVNEPSWLRFIGDRGVRTVEDAHNYISKGPVEMYRCAGFGLYLTELRDTGVPIGLCGPIRREGLADVDLGFAFLPEFWGRGYAHEAAAATMVHAHRAHGLTRIVAFTAPDNESSTKLLRKLGFVFEGTVRLSDARPESNLFGYRF
jgi:RimJ/RimL family protein N-acetyltransferase